MPRSKQDYIDIGERYSTSDVLKEAAEARERWSTDLDLLKTYSQGTKKLQEFDALVTQLTERHTLYKAQVGAKLAALPTLEDAITTARAWVFQGQSILKDRIRDDQGVAGRVRAIGGRVPEERGQLKTFSTALFQILKDERKHLDEEAATDDFYTQGQQTIADLEAAGTQKTSRRQAKEVGTTELDELDGRVHERIADLNEAGRKAFRAKKDLKRADQYVFAYLTAAPAKAPAPDAPAAAPQSPDASPKA